MRFTRIKDKNKNIACIVDTLILPVGKQADDSLIIKAFMSLYPRLGLNFLVIKLSELSTGTGVPLKDKVMKGN